MWNKNCVVSFCIFLFFQMHSSINFTLGYESYDSANKAKWSPKKLKNDGDVDDNAKHDNLIATELPTCLGSDNILYIKRQIHNYWQEM